jgi:hypothetical protein
LLQEILQETKFKNLKKIKFSVLCGMLMTASDVSAIAKPWEIQHKLAKRVADEFFDQGDMEKLRLNTQPIVSHISFQMFDKFDN